MIRLFLAVALAAITTTAIPQAASAANTPRGGSTKVMALNPSAFSPDANNESDQMTQQRRNRLNAILGGVAPVRWDGELLSRSPSCYCAGVTSGAPLGTTKTTMILLGLSPKPS
jgi:hypothetical protein